MFLTPSMWWQPCQSKTEIFLKDSQRLIADRVHLSSCMLHTAMALPEHWKAVCMSRHNCKSNKTFCYSVQQHLGKERMKNEVQGELPQPLNDPHSPSSVATNEAGTRATPSPSPSSLLLPPFPLLPPQTLNATVC